MGPTPPPHWTFAARAAYFGDRMCGACDHRNPAGARFCNDCGAALDLKPCIHCDAVNDQTASRCHRCGAAYGLPSSIATSVPGAERALATASPDDVANPPPAKQPVVGIASRPDGTRLPVGTRVLVMVVATILVAGACVLLHHEAGTGAETAIASGSTVAEERKSAVVERSVPLAVVSIPADNSSAAALPVSDRVDAAKRASTRQRAVLSVAEKRSSARQRATHERRAVGIAPVAARLAVPRADARDAQSRASPAGSSWQTMHATLAGCGGDPITRAVCEQRVRRHFCSGHWGKAPDCAGGIVNDHGQ